MFDKVLNMSLAYLSCFVMVLRGIQGNVLYMPDWFWSHTWKYYIQANKRLTKVKEKWSTIQFCSFILFIPVSQTIIVINRSGICYIISMHQTSVYWLVHMQSHASNREDCLWSVLFPKKIKLDFGFGLGSWSCFCLSRVLKEQSW